MEEQNTPESSSSSLVPPDSSNLTEKSPLSDNDSNSCLPTLPVFEEGISSTTKNCASMKKSVDCSPSFMFGSASTKQEVKSALFQFGSLSIAEVSSGFDSADSIDDADLLTTREAVASAIEFMDKGLQEDDKNKEKSCNNEIHGDSGDGHKSKDYIDSRSSSMSDETKMSSTSIDDNCCSIEDNHSRDNENNEVLGIIQEESGGNKVVKNYLQKTEEKIGILEKEERKCFENIKNTDNEINNQESKNNIAEKICKDNTPIKQILEENEIILREKLNERENNSKNNLVHGPTDQNIESENKYIEQEQNESDISHLIVKEYCCETDNRRDQSNRCGTEVEQKEKSDEIADTDLERNQESAGGNGKLVQGTANIDMSPITSCEDTSSISIDKLPITGSREEFIGESEDGRTFSVTLENIEVSVFEDGSTYDFSPEFLKSKDMDESSDEENHAKKPKQKADEFKLDDAVISYDEDSDENISDNKAVSKGNISDNNDEVQSEMKNNEEDDFKSDNALLSSNEEGSSTIMDCEVEKLVEENASEIKVETKEMDSVQPMEVEDDITTFSESIGEKQASSIEANPDKIQGVHSEKEDLKKPHESQLTSPKPDDNGFLLDEEHGMETDNSSDVEDENSVSSVDNVSNMNNVSEEDGYSRQDSMEEDDTDVDNSEVKSADSDGEIANSSESKTGDEASASSSNVNFTDLVQSIIDKNDKILKSLTSGINSQDKDDKESREENSKETEVISLVDDDDDNVMKKRKPAAAIKCVNPNCMSGEDLDRPAIFVLTYFGLKRSKDQQVCAECFNMVAEHEEKLATMLKEGISLYTANFPSHRDVILLDSDEESFSDNEEELSGGTVSMIEENLDDVIIESIVKYKLDHQIREACDYLNNKFDSLEDEAVELTNRFDQVQQTLDEFRKCIYKDFTQQPVQESEDLVITDCEIPPMPIMKSRVQNQLYNKELMDKLRKAQQEKDAGFSQSPSSMRTIATKKITQGHYDNVTQEVIALHSEMKKDPPADLPPPGPLVRPKLKVGDVAYFMKKGYFCIWVLVQILEVIPKNPTEEDPFTESYRFRLENVKKNAMRVASGQHLAYTQPARVQLKVGTRVIAIFREEEDAVTDKEYYYVGVIAEPPKSTNKFRYLVFFDDGYTQYCPHNNVLVVCSSRKNVWEDIHPEAREFIRTYLQQYPERPMVKMSKGQVVKVEWNGKWWIVRVLEVDASLVKVYFDADKRTEWIYRGSTRLGPMYTELAAAKERQSGTLLRSRGFGGVNANKSDMPYVEYTRGDLDEKRDEEKDSNDGQSDEKVEEQLVIPTRSVARKSTAKKPPEPVITNTVYAKPLVNHVPQGQVVNRKLKTTCWPIEFQPHQCNRGCVALTGYTPSAGKHYDPLIKPLMFGFLRMSMMCRGKTVILYKAPCGRMIRTQQEMLCYLQGTKSSLTIDLFDFDYWVNVLNEFKEGESFGRIGDLSYGKENVAISCVNELDHSLPQYVQYMTARQPAKDVRLNLDPEFLVGCDCKDDCEDRSKCSCWQLTMQGKAFIPDGDLDPLFGYQYRRLPERIATGIYECNSRCKCSATCQNRVAQQPLSCRLQLFKTPMKGWGIRCLHDIPRGSFICIYAGFLLTEHEANEGGTTYGDEYLAELDYIESVENLKEGYESEARDLSDFEEDDNRSRYDSVDIEYEEDGLSRDSDMDFEDSATYKNKKREDIRLRLRRRTIDDAEKEAMKKLRQDDDTISISDEEADTNSFYYTVTPISDKARKPQTFNANITENEDHEPKFPSVRSLYGVEEQVFIMDAKTHGNIGRYLNHSCSPNVFVQNVFVDTHDLRFPWVAFFANQYIAAGTELTWDYNYDVGSVPGKAMLCYCGSANCRGRLL